MPTRSSSGSPGSLSKFQAWLGQNFKGFALEVKYKRGQDCYLCALRIRNKTIARASGLTQKAAAEAAAAAIYEACVERPETVRLICRGESAPVVVDDPEFTSNIQARTATPNQSTDSGNNHLKEKFLSVNKELLRSEKQVQQLALELKKLQGESDQWRLVPSLQRDLAAQFEALEASTRLELSTELAKQKADFKASDSQIVQRLRDLESRLELMAEKNHTGLDAVDDGCSLSWENWKSALERWIPAWRSVGPLVLASLMACKILHLENLSMARAIEAGLVPWARLSVYRCDSSWICYRNFCGTIVESFLIQALDQPDRLHLLCFDGVSGPGLVTWGRPLLRWALGVTRKLPGFTICQWPVNFRLLVVGGVATKPIQLPWPYNLLSKAPSQVHFHSAAPLAPVRLLDAIAEIWEHRGPELDASKERLERALQVLGAPEHFDELLTAQIVEQRSTMLSDDQSCTSNSEV